VLVGDGRNGSATWNPSAADQPPLALAYRPLDSGTPM